MLFKFSLLVYSLRVNAFGNYFKLYARKSTPFVIPRHEESH
jgi:hypothetical protein